MEQNSIDWSVVATIVAPLIALFVGVALNQMYESRPRLIVYYGHASSFLLRGVPEQPAQINMHSVVLRNVGRKAATNVRLGHKILEHFQVSPDREYQEVKLDGGGKELLFPVLVPNEEVTVSYLYLPPTVYSDVNTYAKSDEGFAKFYDVIPTPRLGKWLSTVAAVLMLAGAVAILYAAWTFFFSRFLG